MKIDSLRQRLLVSFVFHVMLCRSCGSDLSNNVINYQGSVEDTKTVHVWNEEQFTAKKTNINIGETGENTPINDDIYSIMAEENLINPVLIKRWRCGVDKCNKSFDIDSSLDTVLVEVRSQDAPDCDIINPDGDLVTVDGDNITLSVNNTKVKITSIKYPLNGRWSLACRSNKEYDVTIKGSSLIDFTPSFIDNNSITMTGRPITGSNTTLTIEVSGLGNLYNLTNIVFTTLHGDWISTYPAGNAIGHDHRVYKCHVIVPNQDFMISVSGYDMTGLTFERLFQTPIVPAGIKLTLEKETKVNWNKYLIQYRITNDGVINGTYNISVIVDVKIFSYIVQPQSVLLGKNDHVICNVTFTAKGKPGDTSLAVISVIGDHGMSQFSSIQLFVGSPDSTTTGRTVSHTPTTRNTSMLLYKTSNSGSTQSSKGGIKTTSGTTTFPKISIISSKGSTITSKGSITSTTRSVTSFKGSTAPKTVNVNSNGSTISINDTVVSSSRTVHVSAVTQGVSSSMPSSDQSSVSGQTTNQMSDLNPPAFTRVDYIDNCRSDDVCDKYQWIVFFQVQDDESGVHRVDVDDKTLTTISIESFSDGLSKTPIHGNVSINCCKKQVTIIVEDMEGNRGRFPVHYHHKKRNSTNVNSIKDTSLSSIQIASIVVGSFAGCLVSVIVITLIVQITSYRTKLQRKLSNKKLARVV